MSIYLDLQAQKMFDFFKNFAYLLQLKVLHPIAPTANYTQHTLSHTYVLSMYAIDKIYTGVGVRVCMGTGRSLQNHCKRVCTRFIN